MARFDELNDRISKNQNEADSLERQIEHRKITSVGSFVMAGLGAAVIAGVRIPGLAEAFNSAEAAFLTGAGTLAAVGGAVSGAVHTIKGKRAEEKLAAKEAQIESDQEELKGSEKEYSKGFSKGAKKGMPAVGIVTPPPNLIGEKGEQPKIPEERIADMAAAEDKAIAALRRAMGGEEGTGKGENTPQGGIKPR